MARRLYLGRLPTDARSEDVNKFFEGQGRIVDCRVMTGFGFVEFENSKDAEDAVQNLNGKPFMGTTIVVEFAKESRPRREPYEDRNHGAPRSRRPPGIRLIVSGVSRDTSWQDLKDFGRDAGSVSFADIDRDVPGQGILEYLNRDDADRAVKELDGKELRGRPVRVALDDSVSSLPLPTMTWAHTPRSALALTIIVAMIVVMTGAVTTAIVTTATATTEATAEIAQGRLLAAHLLIMTTVVPGLHPPGGRGMIEGLQGTMITDEAAMMTAEALIIMMTVAGMILTDAETIEDATRRTTAMKRGHRGPPRMEMVDGLVDWS
ncbi:hypothetical protein H0H81_008148 [Sphagnurus paluster]|uniref:RRM domain-containing protein n=1 Tax=Sphagnurus paluster TaxID=117069 RepID=A0A9P7FUA8_9AGAR|nr:hypothetical protein H0H81_008148 [Sphagnurus paluster]